MCDMFQRLEKMLQKFLMSKPKLKLSSNIFTKTKKRKKNYTGAQKSAKLPRITDDEELNNKDRKITPQKMILTTSKRQKGECE